MEPSGGLLPAKASSPARDWEGVLPLEDLTLGGLGRILIWIGGGLLVLGLLLVLIGKIPGLGRLPGDFLIKRENVTIYIPLGTMILVSVVLTLLFNLIARLRR
jgi:hypothetical protein